MGAMRLAGRIIATLLTGVVAKGLEARAMTPVADQARSTPAQTESDVPSADQASNPVDTAANPTQHAAEFFGSDGKPLPPEIQQQLREQLKKNPPPITKPMSVRPSTQRAVADGDITVTGQRPRGSVVGDIPPQRTFSPLDIRAYGASNIGELLQNLDSQVSSNRGREDSGPITLLNGRRISDSSEVSRIPTEAIERIEVFPEELALKYGYRADQKVVNIVVFQRFNSITGQINYLLPTEGSRNTGAVIGDYFAIRNDTRFSFGSDYSRSGSLLESERDLLQIPGAPNVARFRTLLPETERLTLNGLVSGNLLGEVSSTLNGRFEESGSESLLGLGNGGPLRRNLDTRLVHLGSTLSGRAGKWLWTFTGNYDNISTQIFTDIDRLSGTRDEARSVNTLAGADLLLSGPVFDLPAGPLSTSVRGSVQLRDFHSEALRGGVQQRADLSRDRGAIQVNLDLPITGRRAGAPSRLGSLSANANLEVEQLSDLGALRTFGYGLNWSPVEAINVIASATNEQGAPTVEQLGGPLVVTPNVRIFDFTRREVVDITRVFGGNQNLRFDSRHVTKFGFNVRPFSKLDLTLNFDYVGTRIDNPIAPFPIATPEIEAAFPARFTRDTDGRLLRIDSSPLNFQQSRQEQLRMGFNFTRPLGSAPAGTQNAGGRFYGSESELRRALPPGRRIVVADPGSPLARRLENMTSRLFFSLYHTWHLKDELLVREGVPELDLLDGAAIDFRGGRRRHEIEFQAGVFKRGLGARVTANWQSETRVRGLSGGASDLRFSDFGTVNISLFANLADYFRVTSPSLIKATRISIGINNLFNSRPEVRDEAGLTPISYQPAYLDPLGRSISFNIRKIF